MRRIDLTKAQAARSSTIRDINRQFVLNYIRDREPISRAEIARVTALQRSTVSTIVEELKTEGLIEEIGAGASTGGRRPTLIRLRGAGAIAAALAELWFGRPEVSDSRDFIMALVAEGIGTGIVFDGQIYRGEGGAAGEFGHMIVGENGPVACSCGNRDCWEAFASERAAVARYLKNTGAPEDEPPRAAFVEVVERALGGEQAAICALTETAHYLGIGISNLIVGLSPETVVVGGTITRAWPIILPSLEETIMRSIRRGLPSARIVASTLSEPTLMGSISLVLARKFGLAEI